MTVTIKNGFGTTLTGEFDSPSMRLDGEERHFSGRNTDFGSIDFIIKNGPVVTLPTEDGYPIGWKEVSETEGREEAMTHNVMSQIRAGVTKQIEAAYEKGLEEGRAE